MASVVVLSGLAVLMKAANASGLNVSGEVGNTLMRAHPAWFLLTLIAITMLPAMGSPDMNTPRTDCQMLFVCANGHVGLPEMHRRPSKCKAIEVQCYVSQVHYYSR